MISYNIFQWFVLELLSFITTSKVKVVALSFANLSFIFYFSTSFWIICFCCKSSPSAINSPTFIFSSISCFLMTWKTCLWDAYEILYSREFLDFFWIMLPWSEALLLLLDEHFVDLVFWKADLECQHHQTNHHRYFLHLLPTTDYTHDVHLTTSWKDYWIPSSPLQQSILTGKW